MTNSDPAAPEVAADAALDGPSDRFNFTRWLQTEELVQARKLEALFSWDTPFAENHDAARKFHQRRRTGMLTPRSIDMLVRFYPECHLAVEPADYPDTLDQLLRKETLSRVLEACRKEVHQMIEIVSTEADGLDGDANVLRRFLQARDMFEPDTDLVDIIILQKRRIVALLFLGYARHNPGILAAAQRYRQHVIDKIELCPAWNRFLGGKYNDQWPEILGISLQEGQELQQQHVEEKEKQLKELRGFL